MAVRLGILLLVVFLPLFEVLAKQRDPAVFIVKLRGHSVLA